MERIQYIVLLFFLLILNVQAAHLQINIEDKSFNLLYWPAQTTSKRAVVMATSEEGEGSELLIYFAKKLSENNWSIVMLDNTISWAEQLPEVIHVLRQDNNKKIVLVHYGDQLNQSLNYFTQPQSKMVNGLVMVSAYDEQNENQTWNLRFPVFDIVGQFDYDEVLRQTALRKKEFPSKHYLAAKMPGAYHDYEYNRQLLLAFMQGWMAKLPEFKPVPPPILLSYIEPIYPSESYISAIGEYFKPMIVGNF